MGHSYGMGHGKLPEWCLDPMSPKAGDPSTSSGQAMGHPDSGVCTAAALSIELGSLGVIPIVVVSA